FESPPVPEPVAAPLVALWLLVPPAVEPLALIEPIEPMPVDEPALLVAPPVLLPVLPVDWSLPWLPCALLPRLPALLSLPMFEPEPEPWLPTLLPFASLDF